VRGCGGNYQKRCNCQCEVEGSPHGGEVCRELPRWASFFFSLLKDLAEEPSAEK